MKKIYLFLAIVALAFSYASAQTGWTLNWWDSSNPFGNKTIQLSDKYSGQGIVFPTVDSATKTATITFDQPVTIPVGFKFKVVPTHWGDGNSFYMTNKTAEVLPGVKLSLSKDNSVGSDVMVNTQLDNIVQIVLEETDKSYELIYITFVRKEVAPETSMKQYVIDFWSNDYQKFQSFGTIQERTTLGGAKHHSLILQKQDNGTWVAAANGANTITVPAGRNMFAVVGLDNTDLTQVKSEHWYQNGTVSASNTSFELTTAANEGVDITNGLEHVSKIVVIPSADESKVEIRFEASTDVTKEQSDYWINAWDKESAIPNETYFYKYNGILPDHILVIYNANGFKVGAEGVHFTIKSNGHGVFGGTEDPTQIKGNTPVQLDDVNHKQLILEAGIYYRIYFNTITKTFFALTSPKEKVASTVDAFNAYSEGDIIRLNSSCQTRYDIDGNTVISSLKNTGSEYDVKAVDANEYDQADWIKLDKPLADGVYSMLFVRKGKADGEASLIMEGIRSDGDQRIDNVYPVYNFDQSWFLAQGFKEENVVDPRKFEHLVVKGYYYNDGADSYCIAFPSEFNNTVNPPLTADNILKVKIVGNFDGLQSCFPNTSAAPYYEFEGWFDGAAVNVTKSTQIMTSVEDVEASKAVVLGGVGQISVLNAENVQVYTIGGALISNSAETQCAPGIYVVRADNSVVKVVVK